MNMRAVVAGALACSLISANVVLMSAQAKPAQASPYVVRVVTDAAKRGAWVHLVMRDKRVFKGRILEASLDSFVIRVDATGAVETLRYADVRKAKGRPTPAVVKLAVAGGAIVGAILLYLKVLLPS